VTVAPLREPGRRDGDRRWPPRHLHGVGADRCDVPRRRDAQCRRYRGRFVHGAGDQSVQHRGVGRRIVQRGRVTRWRPRTPPTTRERVGDAEPGGSGHQSAYRGTRVAIAGGLRVTFVTSGQGGVVYHARPRCIPVVRCSFVCRTGDQPVRHHRPGCRAVRRDGVRGHAITPGVSARVITGHTMVFVDVVGAVPAVENPLRAGISPPTAVPPRRRSLRGTRDIHRVGSGRGDLHAEARTHVGSTLAGSCTVRRAAV